MTYDEFDPWTGKDEVSTAGVASFLTTKRIKEIVPFDGQPSTTTDETVPQALMPQAFGPVPLTEAHTDAADLDTFAILDGARIPNLPETLEASGLEHRCLYQGRAFDDLGDIAPWIVKLEPENSFTKALFTASDAPWHMWGKGAGIILRAQASLVDVLAHFRKFTKAKAQDDKMVLFRFWDPAVARIYFSGMAQNETRISQVFFLASGAPIHMLAEDGDTDAVYLMPSQARGAPVSSYMITFAQADHRLFQEVTYAALAREIETWLPMEYPDKLSGYSKPKLQQISHHVVATGRQFGLRQKEDFAFIAQMMMTSGGWFIDDGQPSEIRAILQDDVAKKTDRLVAAYAGAQAKTPQGILMDQWVEVQAHLAGLGPSECVTPDQFKAFSAKFLSHAMADLPAALAGTKARLQTANLGAQQQEGKALILCLILGPRFYEDPFQPWSDLPPTDAIDAAWGTAIGEF